MLSRVLVDIYHLKRIHMVVHDRSLADILKSKICRLNLKPAVVELRRQRAHGNNQDSVGSPSSHIAADRHSGRRLRSVKDQAMPSSTRGDALDHTFALSDGDAGSTPLPDPPSIGFLLECIAYFDLGSAGVTADALELAKAALPFMSSTLACTTLAACCALEHEEVMPLLLESLGDEAVDGVNDTATILASVSDRQPSGTRTHHGLLRGGSITLRFIEALRRIGVTSEAVWQAVAAHCVRCLDELDGKDIVHLIELLYEQRMLCYPELYAAVEAHVAALMQLPQRTASSPPSWDGPSRLAYMSPAQVQQLLFYYTELGLSTEGLRRIATQSYEGRGFDGALDVAATQADLSAPRSHATLYTARLNTPKNSFSKRSARHADRDAKGRTTDSDDHSDTATKAALTQESMHAEDAPGAGRAQPRSSADAEQRQQQRQQLDAFLSRTSELFLHADHQELVELISKCAAKHVMHATLMEAAVTRITQLYFPEGIPTAATVLEPHAASASASSSPPTGSHAARVALPAPLRTEQGKHLCLSTLTLLLRFEDPRFFATCRQPIADMLNVLAHDAAVQSTSNLSLVYGACTLLPPPSSSTSPVSNAYRPPALFFEAVMSQLRRARDMTAHENHARLLQLVRTLLALSPLGGRALLAVHMPSITVAATNAPRAVQVELLAALADLPEAARGLVPALLHALGPVRDRPGWYRVMSPGEVRVLLDALIRSRALTGGIPSVSASPSSSPAQHTPTPSSVAESEASDTLRSAAGTSAESAHGDIIGAGPPTLSAAVASSDAVDPRKVSETTAVAAAALITGIVAFIKTHKARFEPSDLTQHLHTLAQLGYRELDFFVSTSEHLLNVAVYTESSAFTRAAGGGGVAAGAGHTPTSVHDLSLLLYVFTYLLRGVIRVTQQIMARLKVSISQANPRDISLILYSLVRLGVSRPRELSSPLCDRAVAVFADFTAAELASVWSSLRALGDATDALLQATVSALNAPTDATPVTGEPTPSQLRTLSAGQRLTITAAVVAVSQRAQSSASSASAAHGSANSPLTASVSAAAALSAEHRSTGREKVSLVQQLSLQSHPVLKDARHLSAPSSTTTADLFPSAHALAGDAVAQTAFLQAAARVCRTRQLSGLQLSLAVTTLAAMPLAPLDAEQWCLFALQADRLCACLGTGDATAQDADAETAHVAGAAVVLIALVRLHALLEPNWMSTSTTTVPRRWLMAMAAWPRPSRAAETRDQDCPLPPHLVAFIRARITLLMTTPLLKEHMRRVIALDTDDRAVSDGASRTSARRTPKPSKRSKKEPETQPPALGETTADRPEINLGTGDEMNF